MNQKLKQRLEQSVYKLLVLLSIIFIMFVWYSFAHTADASFTGDTTPTVNPDPGVMQQSPPVATPSKAERIQALKSDIEFYSANLQYIAEEFNKAIKQFKHSERTARFWKEQHALNSDRLRAAQEELEKLQGGQ